MKKKGSRVKKERVEGEKRRSEGEKKGSEGEKERWRVEKKGGVEKKGLPFTCACLHFMYVCVYYISSYDLGKSSLVWSCRGRLTLIHYRTLVATLQLLCFLEAGRIKKEALG